MCAQDLLSDYDLTDMCCKTYVGNTQLTGGGTQLA